MQIIGRAFGKNGEKLEEHGYVEHGKPVLRVFCDFSKATLQATFGMDSTIHDLCIGAKMAQTREAIDTVIDQAEGLANGRRLRDSIRNNEGNFFNAITPDAKRRRDERFNGAVSSMVSAATDTSAPRRRTPVHHRRVTAEAVAEAVAVAMAVTDVEAGAEVVPAPAPTPREDEQHDVGVLVSEIIRWASKRTGKAKNRASVTDILNASRTRFRVRKPSRKWFEDNVQAVVDASGGRIEKQTSGRGWVFTVTEDPDYVPPQVEAPVVAPVEDGEIIPMAERYRTLGFDRGSQMKTAAVWLMLALDHVAKGVVGTRSSKDVVERVCVKNFPAMNGFITTNHRMVVKQMTDDKLIKVHRTSHVRTWEYLQAGKRFVNDEKARIIN
jgi:hypothetical protein